MKNHPPTIVALTTLAVALAPAVAQGPPADPGFVMFRGASFPIHEGDAEAEVIVRRFRGSSGAVSVAYRTVDGSALAGEDYEATEGTLEWADGDSADKTVTIPLVVDAVGEPLERFGVVLSDATGGLSIGAVGQATVMILPHGQAPPPSTRPDEIRLRSAAFPAFEGTGVGSFVAVRKGSGAGAASVAFDAFSGSATEGEDFEPASGILEWADGELGEKRAVLTLIDDTLPERPETISIVLSDAIGAGLGGRDTASVLIIDNDNGGGGDCLGDDETLCLGQGRFSLRGNWRTGPNQSGAFRAVPATDDSGFFWFFDEANIEVIVKVLDGCALNDRFWIFTAATTNVGYTLEVTDTLTGVVRRYENAPGVRAPATTDTNAFVCQ